MKNCTIQHNIRDKANDKNESETYYTVDAVYEKLIVYFAILLHYPNITSCRR